MDLLNEFAKEPEYAKKRTRIFAALIDFTVLMAIAWSIAAAFNQVYFDGNTIGFNLTGFPALLVLGIYFLITPVNEGITGQTIGKRLLKIKVIKTDLSKTTIPASIVRHLLDPVDCFFLIGLIVASNNKHKQRIGDLAARTYVVIKH